VAKESSSLKNALPAHQPKWAEKLAGRTVAMMAKVWPLPFVLNLKTLIGPFSNNLLFSAFGTIDWP